MVVTSAFSPSQSHKTADGGKRSLEITLCNPLLKQDHQEPRTVSSQIFNVFRDGYNHSRLPISVFDHSHCEKVFSCIQMEFHWF